MNDQLLFFTMGMFIIDEIEYTHGKESERNIIGGAGTYAALGARLAAGPQRASRVGWIVDQGLDFPPELRDLIDRWYTSCRFRIDPNRLTTRAWNGYGSNELRAFKYLTPKKRLEAIDLSDSEVRAASFHMVCSPKRCVDLVKSVKYRREELKVDKAPIFVWEPVPDLCSPEELGNLQIAARCVDVISPNADELAEFFNTNSVQMSRSEMVRALMPELDVGVLETALVVRDGARGSRLYLNNTELHFPAYHCESTRVIDPTGGGNTYLGALAIGLTGHVEPENLEVSCEQTAGREAKDQLGLRHRQYMLAVIHATIAASFAIEQVGVPQIDKKDGGVWNGCAYVARFHEYWQREHSYLDQQLNATR